MDKGYNLNLTRKFLNEIRPDSEINEFTRQIALADRIVINKLDLVDSSVLHDLEAKIRGINAVADILKTSQAVVPFNFYLDQNCFEGGRRLEFDESFKHDIGGVMTVCIVVGREVREDRLDSWLQMV
jgi:G3E family GTPase